MLVQINSSDEPMRICNVITANIKFDSMFWMIKRIIEFNLWQVPVIMLLWPRKIKVNLNGDPVRFNSEFLPVIVKSVKKSDKTSGVYSTTINEHLSSTNVTHETNEVEKLNDEN